LRLALQISVENKMGEVQVTTKRIIFEHAIKQAKSGDLSALTALLNTAEIEAAMQQPLAKLMSELHPIGDIETAVFSATQLEEWHNIVFLRDQDHSVWAMEQNQDLESITLFSIGAKNFAQLIQATLANL
jgi:hypothetical protein